MIALTQNAIYILALTMGLTVTIAYGLLSLCTIDIRSEEHRGYNIAERIFGTTLLVWALHIAAHALFNIRYTDDYLAITISLSSYFMLATGFEMTLHTLLDASYFTARRVRVAVVRSAVYSLLLAINYLYVAEQAQQWSIVAFSAPLAIIIFQAAFRSIKRYKEVKRNIDNYYSDDTSEAVEWLRYSLYIMLALGFACLVIPYGTALSDSITMLIAIVAVSYVMISMRNYAVRISTIYKNVDSAPVVEPTLEERANKLTDAKIKMLESRIEEWIAEGKFIKPSITIDDLAEDIHSNRRYISEYINGTLNQTFKSWIAELKIEYSKSLLLDNPDYTTNRVAEMIGYSRSNYNKLFSKIVGDSPSNWRSKAM